MQFTIVTEKYETTNDTTNNKDWDLTLTGRPLGIKG